MVAFTLTEWELDKARAIATGRNSAGKGNDRTPMKFDRSRPDLAVNMIGAFAEVGVSKVEGKPINCEVYHGRGQFRDRTDRPDVAKWEIKGTFYKNGMLTVPVRMVHKHRPDRRYLLVRCQPPHGLIVGWKLGADFLCRPECLIGSGMGWTDREKRFPGRSYVARDLNDYAATADRIERAQAEDGALLAFAM